MAALDFPSSPVNGQTYTLNGITYYYDSTVGAWLTSVQQTTIDVATMFGVANAAFGVANAGFGKANTALANTTNTVFSGNISITGTATLGSSLVKGSVVETKVAMAANDINMLSGSYFSKTIGSATTLTVSNVPSTGNAGSFILDLTNGGSGTITWWSGMKWVGGTTPTLTASGRDVLGFFTHDGGTTWSGLVLGKDVK